MVLKKFNVHCLNVSLYQIIKKVSLMKWTTQNKHGNQVEWFEKSRFIVYVRAYLKVIKRLCKFNYVLVRKPRCYNKHFIFTCMKCLLCILSIYDNWTFKLSYSILIGTLQLCIWKIFKNKNKSFPFVALSFISYMKD